MGKYKRIHTKDLKVGMFVEDLGVPWIRHPWLTNQRLLTSKRLIEQLQEYGISHVVINQARGIAPIEPLDDGEPKPPPPATSREMNEWFEKKSTPGPEIREKDPHTVPEELPKARKVYFEALKNTRTFLNDIRAGKKTEVEKVKATVENMIDSIFRNRDAILALAKLRKYDEYTFNHSLNVAVLTVAAGRHTGYRRRELRQLGLGALFHDIGKTNIPPNILNKASKLSVREFELIKQHPKMGMEMAAKQKNISPVALDIIRFHHERLDGSGYPDGLAGPQIDSHIILSSLSDIYDALSTDRSYHRALMPHEALKILFGLRQKHFRSDWVDRFIQGLGIYPVGSTIRMNTNELGLVVGVNNRALLRPQILIVKNSKGESIANLQVIDLTKRKYADIEVMDVVDPVQYGVDPYIYFEDANIAKWKM